MTTPKPPLIILAGPTASGKSDAGVEMAELLGTEIISADSVQVYRHFDIGSAKPLSRLTKRVLHHLIDVVEPEENFTAARFKEEAEKIARRLLSEGRVPLVVGGTGLYLKALTEGMSLGVKVSAEAESRMDEISETQGQGRLYALAKSIDPEWTRKIHPNDTFRARRVVGVYFTTGRKISDIFEESPNAAEWDTLFLTLELPRAVLYRRINERVDIMLAHGWRDEVRRLKNMGYNCKIKPMRSLGYKTLCEESEGVVDPEESARIIKKKTREFAKRQLTWFRKVENAIPIQVIEGDDPEKVAEHITLHEKAKRFFNRHGISLSQSRGAGVASRAASRA